MASFRVVVFDFSTLQEVVTKVMNMMLGVSSKSAEFMINMNRAGHCSKNSYLSVVTTGDIMMGGFHCDLPALVILCGHGTTDIVLCGASKPPYSSIGPCPCVVLISSIDLPSPLAVLTALVALLRVISCSLVARNLPTL